MSKSWSCLFIIHVFAHILCVWYEFDDAIMKSFLGMLRADVFRVQ